MYKNSSMHETDRREINNIWCRIINHIDIIILYILCIIIIGFFMLIGCNNASLKENDQLAIMHSTTTSVTITEKVHEIENNVNIDTSNNNDIIHSNSMLSKSDAKNDEIQQMTSTNNGMDVESSCELVTSSLVETTLITQIQSEVTTEQVNNVANINDKFDLLTSWANMKLDNPILNLTSEQKRVINYFDNDYFQINSYDNLIRYPKVFRNTQISFSGLITNVIDADDDIFECAILVNAAYDNEYGLHNAYESIGYIIIKGKQMDARIIKGDYIRCFGRYVDVENYLVDGINEQIPVVSVNRYQKGSSHPEYGFYPDNPYSLYEINEIAKSIFGDVKISVPDNNYDWSIKDTTFYEWAGEFYIITPDNQSNSLFKQFEMFTCYPMLLSAQSTANRKYKLDVAADFMHYYTSLYDNNLNLLYLEYYDRNYKKLWERIFYNVDTVPYDYTAEAIYLVADNDLYIISTKNGEDKITPVFVGQKVKVNVTNDGIILIGLGNKDNIMKVDFEGKIIWKASADINIYQIDDNGESCSMQIINDNIIVFLVDQDNSDGIMQKKYVVLNADGKIIFEFIDYENISPYVFYSNTDKRANPPQNNFQDNSTQNQNIKDNVNKNDIFLELSNTQIDEETKRIRNIWNEQKEAIANNKYIKKTLSEGVYAYYDNYYIKIIEVPKTSNKKISITFSYNNNRLIFAYVEGDDSYRIYYKDDKVFKIIYCENAKDTNSNTVYQGKTLKQMNNWIDFASSLLDTSKILIT